MEGLVQLLEKKTRPNHESKKKKNQYLIGNRTRHLPACSTMEKEIYKSHICEVSVSMVTPREDYLTRSFDNV
jgi:hypothetical protein